MSSKSFFGRLRSYGYLMLSYSLAKRLGLLTATVLERILTEYQHSISNDLNVKGWFVINYVEIGYHLNLDTEEVEEAVEALTSYGLIELREYNDLLLAQVQKETLVNFVKTAEINYDFKLWDYLLMPMQEQILNIEDEIQKDN